MKLSIDNKSLKSATVAIDFVSKQVPKAFSAALNRVGQGMKTEASRKVRETYHIRAGDVSKYGNIRVTKSDPARLQLLLTSRGRNIPLIRFSTSPTSPPRRPPSVLRAAVRKGGGKKPIPGAFVARMQSGHVGVFMRSGTRRLPVNEKYGPAVPVMLNEPGVTEHLQKEAVERMRTRLDHEMNRVLGRLKTR